MQITQGCRNANETPNAILTAHPHPHLYIDTPMGRGRNNRTKAEIHFSSVPLSPLFFSFSINQLRNHAPSPHPPIPPPFVHEVCSKTWPFERIFRCQPRGFSGLQMHRAKFKKRLKFFGLSRVKKNSQKKKKKKMVVCEPRAVEFSLTHWASG